MLIDLLRHGEPEGGRRYRGQLDDPLSDKGWQQMWAAVEGQNRWQLIISSTLCRCLDFSRALSLRLGVEVKEEMGLKELGFGEWEGKTTSQLCLNDSRRVSNFFNDPLAFRPKGAELLDDFSARVLAVWDEILLAQHHPHILMVAHAGVIRLITAHVLGMPVKNIFRLKIDNAAINRILVEEDKPPVLLMHNGRLVG